jgi:hypothetical protein
MADVKISALPVASSVTSGHQFPANQVGTTRSVTLEQIHDFYLLGRGGAAANINNSTTTTSIYSVGIPARYMGTNRTVRTFLVGEYWHSAGATATLTARIGLSSTTLYQDASAALAVSANSRPVCWEVELTNLAATNSQVLGGKIIVSGTGGATTGQGDLAATATQTTTLTGTAAVDTTSAVTLDFFVRHSAASALITYRHWYGYTELI